MAYEYKDELRELLPVYLDILADEGQTEYRGHGFYNCPLCGSGTKENGTAAFHVHGEHWYCFACNAGGDIFDLVAWIENIPIEWWKEQYRRTLKIMQPYLSGDYESVKIAKPRKKYKDNEDFTEYLMECHAVVQDTEYFKNRGLSEAIINRFKLGYDGKKNVVTIPYNLDFKGYIHRALWDAPYKYWKYGADIFNKEALYTPDTDYVFCCEGQIDGMSFEECEFSAIGLGGVTEINRLVYLLIERPTSKTIIAALDNDAKGKETTRHLNMIMKDIDCKYFDSGNLYGKYKDANHFLRADREGFVKQMQHIVDIVEGRSIEK